VGKKLKRSCGAHKTKTSQVHAKVYKGSTIMAKCFLYQWEPLLTITSVSLKPTSVWI